MENFISQSELASFRKFTLSSGYNENNTKFVRVKDGYSVGADPLKIRKNLAGDIKYVGHHVRYEGFVYGCRPGYVLATLKNGERGWSSWVEINGGFVTFNPFIGKKVILESIGFAKYSISMMDIDSNSKNPPEQSDAILGEWHLPLFELGLCYYMRCEVQGVPFKGIKSLLAKLAQTPAWHYFWFNDYAYNESLSIGVKQGQYIIDSADTVYDLFKTHFVECEFGQDEGVYSINGAVFFLKFEGKYYYLHEAHNNKGLDYSKFGYGRVWKVAHQIDPKLLDVDKGIAVIDDHWLSK